MTPPLVNQFLCVNESDGTTIYPTISDQKGTIIWTGKDIQEYKVEPRRYFLSRYKQLQAKVLSEGRKPVDLNRIDPPLVNQSDIVLGCVFTINDKDTSQKDFENPKTYSQIGDYIAAGTKIGEGASGEFIVSGDTTLNVEAPAALEVQEVQEVFRKANTSAVAKLLGAVADLISPET